MTKLTCYPKMGKNGVDESWDLYVNEVNEAAERRTMLTWRPYPIKRQPRSCMSQVRRAAQIRRNGRGCSG